MGQGLHTKMIMIAAEVRSNRPARLLCDLDLFPMPDFVRFSI